MKTYFLQKKADKINATANALEHTLARILKLTNLCDIPLSREQVEQLQCGNTTYLNKARNERISKEMEAYNMAVLLKKPWNNDKALVLDQNLEQLMRDTEYMGANVIPCWNKNNIDQSKLKQFIAQECTHELSRQEQADVDLLDRYAEALSRFNPAPFVQNGKVLVEDYLESQLLADKRPWNA